MIIFLVSSLFKNGLINYLIDNIEEYEEIKLKDIGLTYAGLSGKTKEDFDKGNCKFINFVSVLNDNISIDMLPMVKIKNGEKQNEVQKSDIFFNTSSEVKEEVGLCSTICENVSNVYLNSFCFGFRISDINKVNNEYLNCLLHCNAYRKQISNLGQGFTRVNISKNELLDLLVKIPKSKIQHEIIEVNRKISNKLKLEEVKYQKLNKIKKGLLQNMFV